MRFPGESARLLPLARGRSAIGADTMAILFLLFVLGVLNLVIGYALAVYLGVGPSTLMEGWRVLDYAGPVAGGSDGGGNLAATAVQGMQRQQPEPCPLPRPPSALNEATGPALEPDPMDLDKLRRSVATSASNLADFAARLKKSSRGDHSRTGWAFVTELQAICQPYLARLSEVAERLSDEIGEEIQEIILEQLAQLETTLGNLQHMDFGSGATSAIERLSQETTNTLNMAHTLQKTLQVAPETAA
jgi:hypothetical protein